MKWWGWGDESVTFSHNDKPSLASFFKKHIDLDLGIPPADIIDFESLSISPPVITPTLRSALESAVGNKYVKDDALDRVVHTYGKSLRDVVRVRNGDLGRLPDVVIYPGNEQEVVNIVKAALDVDAVIIPFGGGTNISGSLEAPRDETRTVISVDLLRMNQVIEIDDASRTARIQAGALGPALEEQLNQRGWTLGHFPDSFRHSTLGGWIATRSSGMQSDKFGDIADLTKAVRVVTPVGTLALRSVPSTSTGPSVREMILGSEGRLGIITEATVEVHRTAEKRQILAYLFPNWKSGVDAMRDIAASDATPSITRVSNANETAFSFATKKQPSKMDQLQSDAMRHYLQKVKKFELADMCLSFIGFESSADKVDTDRKLVGQIVRKHGGLCIGSGPGALYDQKKFDTPYIRDFMLDRGALADVSETAAPWATLLPVHEAVVERANKAFDDIGVKGFIMCHLSHSYHSGACLYFTFAFKQSEDSDPLSQYDTVKHAIQQTFIDLGATLSHHHAVGLEHAEWLAQDISPTGVTMISTLLNGMDPGKNFNPGKIVQS